MLWTPLRCRAPATKKLLRAQDLGVFGYDTLPLAECGVVVFQLGSRL